MGLNVFPSDFSREFDDSRNYASHIIKKLPNNGTFSRIGSLKGVRVPHDIPQPPRL